MGKEMETTTTTTTTITMATTTPPRPPLEGISVEEEEFLAEMESYPSNSSFCCSLFTCFGPRPSPARCGTSSSASVWERLQRTAETESPWWAGPLRGLKKARELSEIIAGPKWKTFIRRFNRTWNKPNSGSGSAKFQYDPLSYSLNFDEGRGQNGPYSDDGGYFPDFSSRFASVPSSCKSSMDLGKTASFTASLSSKSSKDLDSNSVQTTP